MKHIKSRKHASAGVFGRAHGLTGAARLATGIALALPGLASAEAADDASAQLPTVYVEGSRVDEYKVDEVSSPKFVKPLLDTTQSIQVIPGDLFNDQGATTLTEALRNSAGVGTFYTGENGNTTTGDAIYMRGFDSQSSIFVDGVRDLGSISRDVFNIEQIEVTKGPAGTDNGRTAPSGAINLVSKQPMLMDGFSGSAALGTDSQQRLTADWNVRLGAIEGAAFRLNLLAQDNGVPGRDSVENARWAIAPSLAFGLGTATRLYLDYLHVKQDNVPDGGVFTIGLPGYASPDPERPWIGDAPTVDPRNFYGTDADHDDVEADMFTAIVQHDFSEDLKLQNSTRWGRTSQDYLLTAFMGTAANLVTPDPTDPSTWTIRRSNPTFKDQVNRILTNQTNLRLHTASRSFENDLSIGAELTLEDLSTRQIAPLAGTAWPAANVYAPDPRVDGLQWAPTGGRGEGRSDTVAVYAFDTLTLGEHWQLNAGVRLDDYDTDFRSTVACTATGANACGDRPPGTVIQAVDADVSDTLFSWKVGALYKPRPNGSFYANYAVSQQPPGGGTLELSAAANNANNPVFDPQEARTAELGTKWELLDQRLLLTAALYRTDVDNEIVRDPVDQLYYQTGEKRVQGIEIGVVGKLSDAWSVSAGFTTLDAKVTEGTPVAQDGSSGLTYTPDKAFTAWTTYVTPWKLTLGGGARYSGEMKRGTDGAVGTPTHTEDYWVFDAVASYPVHENIELRLNAYNLFDEDYVAAINKSGYRYTPGLERSFLLTANVRF
ncbi:MAG: catecholate siderophore receptor Fiu [Lysobacteraceae bacterium]|nr:MAG: catecholate siderophore receptor Fiu [Xanthomonadaceae bacterium]